MDNPQRYIFRGNAAAFGGRIIRPKDIVLETAGASSLPVSGGRSVATLKAAKFDKFFSVESASTFAEGLFDDARQFLEVTNHKIAEQALAATTRVNAEVRGLAVGTKPRLAIQRLRAELTSKSALGSAETPVRVENSSIVEGVTIDRFRLVVNLDPTPFQRFDTRSKLLAACDDAGFVKEYGDQLFMRTDVEGYYPPQAAGRLIGNSSGTIYATLVKSMKWDGPAYPKSAIDRNTVLIPEFGRLHFGELLISGHSRRLTMLRIALGSELGGTVAAADVQDNGSWSWP